MNSIESSNNFVHEKSRSGLHKRQVYMNLMVRHLFYSTFHFLLNFRCLQMKIW
jgi:hypothetical protein